MFCHNWPLKVQKLALKYYLHWFWNIMKKFYLKDYSKFNLSGCASRDPSLQVENNTNRPLGLCKGWSLTAYRGDRAIGAAKYKFDHSIIMECRELLTDTQINQPTLSTIITTDIFADSLHSPCWKDRLSRVFFAAFYHILSMVFFAFLQRSKVQFYQFLVCSMSIIRFTMATK